MSKSIFFIFGVFLSVVILVWIDGYSALPYSKRGGFFQYVKDDANTRMITGKKFAQELPDAINSIIRFKQTSVDLLAAQLQKALQAYYLLENKYPTVLSDVILINNLPMNLSIKYELNGAGYILRIYNSKGEIVKDLSYPDKIKMQESK